MLRNLLSDELLLISDFPAETYKVDALEKSKHNQREIVVLFGYFNSSAMYWTEEHDRLMCREILAVDPFTGTKKGTVQRGAKWKIIADNLSEIMEPKFKVDPRGVRDRYQLLAQKLRKKLKDEQKASGIDTEMSETENAIEELLGPVQTPNFS